MQAINRFCVYFFILLADVTIISELAASHTGMHVTLLSVVMHCLHFKGMLKIACFPVNHYTQDLLQVTKSVVNHLQTSDQNCFVQLSVYQSSLRQMISRNSLLQTVTYKYLWLSQVLKSGSCTQLSSTGNGSPSWNTLETRLFLCEPIAMQALVGSDLLL